MLALPALFQLCAIDALHAANLIQNGEFDIDIAGWSSAGTCTAPAYDSFGPGFADGAMAINCFSQAMPDIERISQCVQAPAADVDFSAQVTNNGAQGPVVFGLSGYAAADCSGAAMLILDPGGTAVTPDATCCGTTWTTFSRAAIRVPRSARSVLVEIIVTTPADIAIDKIRLETDIFDNGFE